MGLREHDEARRLSDPFDPSHRDSNRPGFRALALVIVLTVILAIALRPGPVLTYVIFAIGGALSVAAFMFAKKHLTPK